MIGLLACAVGLMAGQERTAVKQVLPNGSTLYVQRIEGSKTFSVVLASVQPSEPETPETHGARHLLEHLVAKGAKRDVDKLVEGSGMVLLAETTRDAVTFQVSGPSASLSVGLAAVRKLLEGFDPKPDEVKRETGVIAQELALRNWDVLASGDGWLKAYGERAIDPFGDPTAMTGLTVDSLKACFARMTAGKSLCVCVAGPVDAEATARQVQAILEVLPPGPIQELWSRSQTGSIVVGGSGDGVAVCKPITQMTVKESLAAIAAGFGLRAWVPGCRMLMTPTPRNGMVTVALRSGNGWTGAAAKLKGREALVGETGKSLLRTWLSETVSSPAKLAKMTAVMLPLRPGFNPQGLGTLGNDVTQKEVTAQVREFLAAVNPGGGQ